MFKIGLLGGENSHADCFAKYFNMPGAENRNDPAYRVTAVAGNYPEANKKLVDYYGLDFVAGSPQELIGKVDAVMVTARDGKFHGEFARPFIELGMPVFIDKPFTTNFAQAKELIALAKKSGALLSGGSSVKLSGDVEILANLVKTKGEAVHGGNVTAPVVLSSEHSGFWFYASHLTEVSLAVFGPDVRAVRAVRTGGDVAVILEYDRYLVTNHYVGECYFSYQATVVTKERNFTREIDYSLCFNRECENFVNMIERKIMPETYEQLIRPVEVMEAIIRSYETGKRIEIAPIEV